MRLQQARSSSAQRARALDGGLAERRHVDDAGPLAERRVLRPEAVEVRRRRPAERALVGAGPAPRPAGLEVVGPLPAVLRSEHRALLLQPPVQRRRALRAPPLVGVERVAEAVVVAVGLARRRGRELARRGRRRRTARRGRRRRRPRSCPSVIHSAIALPMPPAPPKPFSDSPAASQKPGTPGIGPSSGFASGVIASGWQTSPATPASARNGNRRTAPAISGANRSSSAGSARPPCSHGRAVLPARRRVRLVAAEQHAARLGLAVDEVVGVAEARHVARQLVARHRLQRDVLVVDRDRRREHADHRRHPRRPDAGRVDDDLALDRPRLGVHGPHRAGRDRARCR